MFFTENSKDGLIIRQIPEVNGAIIAMDPHTGKILALSGGFSFKLSEFNRATQAQRQPGSAFKPIVYAAALENGFTPSTLVLDAPFVMDQGQGLKTWKPENYGKKFYGPSTLRTGIEKSRNLMTVRVAQKVGFNKISKITKNGFEVWLIPHTYKLTNISKMKKNSLANIEIDILSKYVKKYFNEK